MKKISLVSALILCMNLSGCTMPDPAPVIKQQLMALHGQPVNALFSRLGYPTNEGKVAGTKFYLWSTSATAIVPDISTTTGYGMAGGQPFNYNQTTFGDAGTVHWTCTLRIFVDKEDKIVNQDINGPKGACKQFAKELDGTSGF